MESYTRRIHKRSIPDTPCNCAVNKPCVYKTVLGHCYEPRTNKGNSDAACFGLGNAKLISMLVRI